MEASRAKTRRGLKTVKPGFDITVEKVVGRVDLDNNEGHLNPIQAAFVLIADASAGHGESGNFKFTVPRDMMGFSEDLTLQVSVGIQDQE